jgi:hypothetical protein
VASVPLNQNRVYFKVYTDFRNQTDKANFSYSLDGNTWTSIGTQLQMAYTLPHFMGYRFALFNYGTKATGGYVDFDYFKLEPSPVGGCSIGGNPPTVTPTRTGVASTNTPTSTLAASPTRTNTPGTPTGPTVTPTRTVGASPTRTNVPGTPTTTPTSGSGGTCSPVTSSITAPFSFDGAGTFCWQSTNLGSFINSWNTNSVMLNGTNVTNIWVGSGSYPAKIGGFWYVSYNSSVAWGHFEAK